ncbi:hypothetical protein ACIQTU_06320 [Brevundimonas sp. NPDC090276]|uniref:hypothetical protein n=1 Tax=Brevundimonas sp. NPDC090276 TaxID=3363956 RepID=UPI00383B3DE8
MMTTMFRTGGQWRLAMWGLIVALLLLPLIAMQFTHEVAWDAADFAFAGLLLVGAGLIFELAAWRTRKLAWRLGIGGALIFAVLLIWADAAVGVF